MLTIATHWLMRALVFTFLFATYTRSHALPQEENFLVLSDVHVDPSSKHLMNMAPSIRSRMDDLDEPTFKQLITGVSENIQRGVIPTPKFILFLGDVVGHERSHSDFVLNSESAVFSELTTHFPRTPILYTFGNNDSFQINYGPFTSSSTADGYKTPLDAAHATGHWSNSFLSTGVVCKTATNTFPCVISENKTDGYYSAYLKSTLRLISLNTVMFSPVGMVLGAEYTTKQLDWLASQLNEAQLNNESVLLTMHIPPGRNVYDNSAFWMPTEDAEFLRLVKKYHQSIIGILAGHTHKDEIKVIQDSEHQPIAGVYLTAALSTSHGNAPSVRTYTYSKQDMRWQLTNYDVFYFVKNSDAVVLLKKLYDYKTYYCVGQEKNILQCLTHVTAEKMEKYFSAGNENYHETINAPQNMIISTLTPIMNDRVASFSFMAFLKWILAEV